MRLHQAIDSGKRFRLPAGEWQSSRMGPFGATYEPNMKVYSWRDLLRDDWEVEEERVAKFEDGVVVVDRKDLAKAWDKYAANNGMLAHSGASMMFEAFCKELGIYG